MFARIGSYFVIAVAYVCFRSEAFHRSFSTETIRFPNRLRIPRLVFISLSRTIKNDNYEIEDEDDSEEYDMTDADLVQVAQEEFEAMSRAPSTVLQPAKSPQAIDLVALMEDDGVLRINEVLSPEIVKEVGEVVKQELKKSIADVEGGKVDVYDRFSQLLSSENRWDLKMPVDDPVIKKALKAMLSKEKPLGKLLEGLVTKNGELFEMAAFYTAPGSNRQAMHADTLWSKAPAVYTCTIALQDITFDMGPTCLIPGSHAKAMHKKFDGERTKFSFLSSQPHVYSALSAGDATIYDSRTLHCGTANKSNSVRMLLYFTFKNFHGPRSDEYYNVQSIRPEFKRKYFLKDFL
jgi:hypothetical protein